MSGGTLTPPRDRGPWEKGELVAPVIPLRQRGDRSDESISEEKEPQAPIVLEAVDEPPGSWIAHGSNLLALDTAAGIDGAEDTPAPGHHRRRRLAGLLALVVALGAAAVVGAVLVPGAYHAPATSYTHQRKPKPSLSVHVAARDRAHTNAPTTGRRARHVTTTRRKRTVAATRTRSTTNVTSSISTTHFAADSIRPKTVPPVSSTTGTGSSDSATSPANSATQPTKTSAPASNPCLRAVPGQLGC